MVASDDPFITSTFKIFLEADYQILCADEIASALVLLKENSFSLVIIGGNLVEDSPGGLQEQIRSGLRWQRLPVLLVTEDKMHKSQLAGEHVIVSRQISRDELILCVDRQIHQDKIW